MLLGDDKLKKRVHNIWKTAGGRDVGREEVKERIDEIKKATSERRDSYRAQLLHAEKEGKELCAVHMQTNSNQCNDTKLSVLELVLDEQEYDLTVIKDIASDLFFSSKGILKYSAHH